MKQNWNFSGLWMSCMSGIGWRNHMLPTVNHGSGWLKLWGSFASSGTRNLQRLEAKIDSVNYEEIFRENVIPSVRKLKLGLHWTFQQDNVPKHTSKSTKTWFQKNSWKILKWPSELPDLNSKENLWWNVKRVFTGCKAKNILEIKIIGH